MERRGGPLRHIRTPRQTIRLGDRSGPRRHFGRGEDSWSHQQKPRPQSDTLVHLGIDLSSATTRASLAAGLREALHLLNLRIAADAPGRTELA